MDDIRLLPQNENEWETLIQSVRIYSQDIGMEFDIEKCAILVMKSGKRRMTEVIELSNFKKSERSEKKKTYKCLGILGADTIKQVEMKEKISKELSQENEEGTRDKTI